MTIGRFMEQIDMERARMFPLSDCRISVEDTETNKTLWIACRGQEKPKIGKVPYAVFKVGLPMDMVDDLPDKMKLEVMTENPKMKLRKVNGSATKILNMLHRNFETMSAKQAAM